MFFRLSFKTPDVLDQICNNSEDGDKARELLSKYVEYGEYIYVTIETDTGEVQLEKLRE